MPGTITYQQDGPVVSIIMDDGKANVLGLATLEDLTQALRQAQSEASTIVLTGRPGMFSGGFDLAVFKRDPAELVQMLEAGARLAELLKSCPRPVVAACTGHAIAMGAFLLLSADLRIGVVVAPELLMQEAQKQAEQLAGLPANAFSATKLRLEGPGLQALRKAIEQDLQDWRRLAVS
jgi:enoyl-CoA hydratase